MTRQFMLGLVGALIPATVLSGAWCAAIAWRDGAPRRRESFAVGLCLAAIVAVALGLRTFLVPPHHAMYVDEPWYAEAACNLARSGRLELCEETWAGRTCASYGKAVGWPLLLTPWVFLTGCDSAIGVYLNRALAGLSVLLVALAARLAGGSWWAGVVAGALLAIHPVHVAWSATGETNVAAAAALLAGVCGALRFLANGHASAALLAASGLALASAIRPENSLPALLCAAVLALAGASRPRRRLAAAAAVAIASLAAAASGWSLWTMNEAISGGAFLSPRNWLGNAARLGREGAPLVHATVAVLALAGGLALARRARGAAWLLLGAGVAAASAVLAYDRFHERMLLVATVALLPLAGLALRAPGEATRSAPRPAWRAALYAGALLVAVGALWWPRLRATAAPPETQQLESRLAAQVARLPLDRAALFIAAQPTVLAAGGVRRVMATREALRGEAELRQAVAAGRPVYFLCDMYCETGFLAGGSDATCREILQRFALQPVAEEVVPGRRYALFRVVDGPPTGAAAARCPRPSGGAAPE